MSNLTVLHSRTQLLETSRVPMAVLGSLLFPVLSLAFFVVPSEAARDPFIATAATAQLVVFAVMNSSLFGYGVGVAEDRAQPWDAYVRTLPVGAGPRMTGRVVTGTAMSALGVIPVLVLAALATEATITLTGAVTGLAALLLASLPFLFGGLAIGYALPTKAALPVAQVVLFPLAFAGGLFLPPDTFPVWLDRLSGFLPSRAARDIVVEAATGSSSAASLQDLVVLLVWILATAALAAFAYRRDEGQRFS